LFFLCARGHAQDSLCQPGEPVVFSCHAGSKTVSLCRPSGLRQELVYRFGTPAKVELTHPGVGRFAAAPFTRETAPLAGGGVTSVGFQRGEYQYSVYSKMARGAGPERAPEFEDGVIISRRGKPVRQLVCDDGGEGFRENLDWLPEATRR
jgi:hypothetical protein